MNTPKSFVIWFENTFTYNNGCGLEVPIGRATRYAFREEADRINRHLQGGVVIEVPAPPSPRAMTFGSRWVRHNGAPPTESTLVRVSMAHDGLRAQAEANFNYATRCTNPITRDRAMRDAKSFQVQANAIRETLRYLGDCCVPEPLNLDFPQ